MNRTYYILIFVMTLLVFNVADAKKKKYPNGDYYEGKWKKGTPNGIGTMNYANGDVYSGNWAFGLKEGQGTMTYANNNSYKEYIGEWKEDKPNGKGKMTFSNNSIYNGDWVLGQMEGFGTMEYTNDSKFKEYTGNWKSSKPNGTGKMIFLDNSVYDGSWIYGQMRGQGKLTYKNGDMFLGTFNATGRVGKLTEANGNWYNGEWNNDKFVKGTCYFDKGKDNKYEGEIINGNYYNGKGVIRLDGNYYDGTWTNGKFVGDCELTGTGNRPKFIGSVNEYGIMYGTAFYGDSIIYKGTLDPNFIPSDLGKLSILKNDSVIGEVDGIWSNGILTKLNEGFFIVGPKSYALKIENNQLMMENEFYTISKHYNKLPDALKKLYIDYDYIISNGLTEQNELFKKKYNGKAFICVTRLDKYEPDLALFLDISSIDVYAIIGMENGHRLVESTIAMVNTNRLKYHDRGYLLQQYGIAKKFIKVNRYDYRIKNGYLVFNNKKYKFINNSTSLYNEKNGLTLKIVSLKEAEQYMNDYLKKITN